MRRALAVLIFLLPPVLMAGGNGAVYFGGHSFKAEVAVTQAEQERGLMYRKQLPKDACMIFLYGQDGPHAIWMRHCYISLDVAWTDVNGFIVEVAENVPPCDKKLWELEPCPCPNYGGSTDSRNFIEFPAGTFKRLGIKKGETLRWDLTLGDGTLLKGGDWGMMLQPR